MRLHPARDRLHERDWTHELFAALAAKRLSRLNCTAASIAKHDVLPNDSENYARIHKTGVNNRVTKRYARNPAKFRFPHPADAASLLHWREAK
jgi:hypothetical protein